MAGASIHFSRGLHFHFSRQACLNHQEECNGREKETDSVNDDLESLFQDLRYGKEPAKFCRTYFFPELTEEDIEKIESNDKKYLDSFFYKIFTDESDSKFVAGFCNRETIEIENSCYIHDHV